MNCCDFDELEAVLKDELDADTRSTVMRHVTDCATCRQRLEEAAANLRMLESLPTLVDAGADVDAGRPGVPETIGNFRIVREIGHGGMGIVYEAHQQYPQRSVAIKVLHKRVSSDAYRVRLFRREARALGRLEHPGIAAIHAADQTEEGQHFLVLELVQGVPLDVYVREQCPDRAQRLLLLRRACAAINYAHQRGVIHLDIKPSNILVDSDGCPKILDFGLARIVDPDVPMTTSIADAGRLQGTLPYMSPEQLGQDPGNVDLRSDVYSLGVILYELLTGRLPYEVAPNVAAGLYRFPKDEPPPRPSSVDRSLRGDLETIMLKALEPDPARRYQSTLALAEDLERLETNQPILARPPSGLYHFRKLVTRHRIPFAAAAAFVVLVMVFGVWMSALYARTLDAEHLARQRLADAVSARELAEVEAERATNATDLARSRLEEANQSRADLETVVDFQANMLVAIEPHKIGQNVLTDLRKRIADSFRPEEANTPQTEQYLTSLNDMLDRVNSAELGTALVHENILRRAAETITEDFADQPRVQARLNSTIGYVYQRLGDFARAEQYMAAALDTYEREFGQSDPGTPLLMTMLARIYQLRGRYDEAEALFLETLSANRQVFGELTLETLQAKLDLGNLYRFLGRVDEAYPLCLEALEGRRRAMGDEHPEVLSGMNIVAGLHYQKGRTAEAAELLEQILSTRRRLLGEDHQETLAAMNNLAFIYERLGQYDKAEPLTRETVDGLRRILGREHPDSLLAAGNLAHLYHSQGRYEEAEPLYVEVLTAKRRVLGNENLSTLQSLNNLAALYSDQGRIADSNALFEEQHGICARVLGKEHMLTLRAMAGLGNNYTRQGRLVKAEALIVPSLELHRRVFGEAHDLTVKAAFSLAALRDRQGRFEEAEALYRKTSTTAKTVWPNGHWKMGWHTARFGAMLGRLQRYDEAQKELIEAHQFLEQAVGAEHPRTREIVGMLVTLFDSWDKPEEAAKYRALNPFYRPNPSDSTARLHHRVQ